MLNNNGFTLVEVLVALVILTLGILSVLMLLNSSLKMAREAQDMTEAGIFISSLSNLINAQDPASLSPEQFSGITYNNQPVVINFSQTADNALLIKVNVILKMKNGHERYFVMYVARK